MQLVCELSLVGQHQAPPVVGSASVEIEIEVGHRSGNAQLQGCDFSGEVAHVIAAQRDHPTPPKRAGYFCWTESRKTTRLNAAEGEDEVARFYRTRAAEVATSTLSTRLPSSLTLRPTTVLRRLMLIRWERVSASR